MLLKDEKRDNMMPECEICQFNTDAIFHISDGLNWHRDVCYECYMAWLNGDRTEVNPTEDSYDN